MKHWIRWMTLALALVLALTLGIAALAEGEADAAPEAPAEESAEAADSAALEDALDAYYAAKDSGRADELEAELKEYVAAGKLTQEQADLILKYYKEQQALRDGVCPNCGYEFQAGGYSGRGGHMSKGGRGRRGMGGMYDMHGTAQSFAMEDDSGTAGDVGLELSAMELYSPFQEDLL